MPKRHEEYAVGRMAVLVLDSTLENHLLGDL